MGPARLPVPLKVLASPYREISRPVVDYVKSIRSGSPRDVVVVYIPEYVLGRWYEQVLHNQSALRLKGPAALHARRHGGQCAVAAALVEGQEDFFDDGPVVGSVRRGPA